MRFAHLDRRKRLAISTSPTNCTKRSRPSKVRRVRATADDTSRFRRHFKLGGEICHGTIDGCARRQVGRLARGYCWRSRISCTWATTWWAKTTPEALTGNPPIRRASAVQVLQVLLRLYVPVDA